MKDKNTFFEKRDVSFFDMIFVTLFLSRSINALDYQVHTPGLADAQLDVERGVVVCTTMPDRYIKALAPGVPNVFGPASLHTGDYPNYWENIRENVRTRTKAYFSRN